jgi:plasmid stability protein
MTTMTLRGIDDRTAAALKKRARHEGNSVNTLTLRLLRQSLGLDKPRRDTVHTDLDHLAGTWGTVDVEEFTRATAAFESIDEALWK